jgi:hypothetical protein
MVKVSREDNPQHRITFPDFSSEIMEKIAINILFLQH